MYVYEKDTGNKIPAGMCSVMIPTKGAVTDKSQPRHKKYTQFYREEGVFFGIIYV